MGRSCGDSVVFNFLIRREGGMGQVYGDFVVFYFLLRRVG